jgi:hypothetical protein
MLQDENVRLPGLPPPRSCPQAGQEGLKVSEVKMQKRIKIAFKGRISGLGLGDCYIRTTLGQQCVEASSIWWRVQ